MDALDANADGALNLAGFLKLLAKEGRAVVAPVPFPEGGDAEALVILRALDELARNELALDAPPFSEDAALWAARLFHQLCLFTVCRDISAESIAAACGTPCPVSRGPDVDWSVDLVLRHLPRLFQMARHLSNADPLVQQMKQIAAAWPLSSAGITGLENLQLDSFIAQPALRRLYADRVIACGDISRLGDMRLDDLLRADLGMHRELAPVVSATLFAKSS